jgi:hypothetical protein
LSFKNKNKNLKNTYLAASTTVLGIRKTLAPPNKNSTSHNRYKEFATILSGIMTIPYHNS